MNPFKHKQMHHQHRDGDTAPPRRSRRWLVGAAFGLAAGAMTLAGASFAGEGRGMYGMHGGRGHFAAMDPATAAKHIDKMVAHILSDGTPEQKTRLADIAKSAFADLQPVHLQFREARAKAHTLLSAPAIDRAALEQLRADEMQRVDQTSKRILLAIEDAAEVLTPEQRVRFAEHMKKRMQ